MSEVHDARSALEAAAKVAEEALLNSRIRSGDVVQFSSDIGASIRRLPVAEDPGPRDELSQLDASERMRGSLSQLRSDVERLLAEAARLREETVRLGRERDEWKNAEITLGKAYIRLREILGAWKTPHGPTPEQVWAHTEECARNVTVRVAKLSQTVETQSRQLRSLEGALHKIIHECREGFDATKNEEPWDGHSQACADIGAIATSALLSTPAPEPNPAVCATCGGSGKTTLYMWLAETRAHPPRYAVGGRIGEPCFLTEDPNLATKFSTKHECIERICGSLFKIIGRPMEAIEHGFLEGRPCPACDPDRPVRDGPGGAK